MLASQLGGRLGQVGPLAALSPRDSRSPRAQADRQGRGLQAARAAAHAAAHHVLDRAGQQPLAREGDVVQADLAGVAGRQAHQLRRWRSFHAGQSVGSATRICRPSSQYRAGDDRVGVIGAGDPGREAVEHEAAAGLAGREHRLGQVAAAGREMRDADGGECCSPDTRPGNSRALSRLVVAAGDAAGTPRCAA